MEPEESDSYCIEARRECSYESERSSMSQSALEARLAALEARLMALEARFVSHTHHPLYPHGVERK